MDMETFNPTLLKRRPAIELWGMRKRVIGEIQSQAFVIENREPTANEKALEERMTKNLHAIDGVIEENLRAQAQDAAFSRFSGLGSQQLSQRDMAAVDWLKSAIVEKNPAAFVIEPEEQRDFSIRSLALSAAIC
jgi:hypothetical protein